MTAQGLLQIAVYIGILVALAKPLGAFMASVYEGQRTFLSPVFGPLERAIYRLSGVDEKQETGWKRYALGVVLVNAGRVPRRLSVAAVAGRVAAQSTGLRCGQP